MMRTTEREDVSLGVWACPPQRMFVRHLRPPLDVVLRPLAPVGAAPKRRRHNLYHQSCNTRRAINHAIQEELFLLSLPLLDRNNRQGKYHTITIYTADFGQMASASIYISFLPTPRKQKNHLSHHHHHHLFVIVVYLLLPRKSSLMLSLTL